MNAERGREREGEGERERERGGEERGELFWRNETNEVLSLNKKKVLV